MPRRSRAFASLVLAFVAAGASPSLAQYEPTTAWDATVKELRSATRTQRDGSHHARLLALRGLGDPALAPFFEALVAGDHWSIQVDGMLGLAELSDRRSVRADLIDRMHGDENRSSALRAALGLRLLEAAEIERMLAWEDLPASDRVLLAAESLRLVPKSVPEATLRRLAESRNDEVAGLASFLLREVTGDGTSGELFENRLDAMPADRRGILLGLLAGVFARYEVRPGLEFLARRLAGPDAKDLPADARTAMLAAILPADADRGYRLWTAAVEGETSAAQVLRLAALLLTVETPLPPDAAAPLRSASAGDRALLAKFADAIEAVAGFGDPSLALPELVATRHRVAVASCLDATRRLPPAEARATLTAIADLVSGGDRVRLPPGVSELAVQAFTQLARIDPPEVERRLAAAEGDTALQDVILFGLFTAGTPEATAIAAKARGRVSRTGESLALLLVARRAESLPETDLRQLALIAAGGGRVEEPLQAQAAWLYARLSGRANEAIAAALASGTTTREGPTP